MLSTLEKTLMSEVLTTRFPGINQQQVESSIQNAVNLVAQASQAAINQQSTQNPASRSGTNENPEWGIKIGGGGNLSLPFAGINVNANAGVSNEGGYHQQTTQNVNPEWGLNFGAGGGISLPLIGGPQFSVNAGVSNERGIFDDFIKPVCQTTAKIVYNAAVGAANALDPVSKLAALTIAKAAFDHAMEKC